MNPSRMALVELLTVRGKPIALVPITSVNLNPEPDPPHVLTMMPTDAEGMRGRRCPKCDSYFRTAHVATRFCPHCDAETSGWTS